MRASKQPFGVFGQAGFDCLRERRGELRVEFMRVLAIEVGDGQPFDASGIHAFVDRRQVVAAGFDEEAAAQQEVGPLQHFTSLGAVGVNPFADEQEQPLQGFCVDLFIEQAELSLTGPGEPLRLLQRANQVAEGALPLQATGRVLLRGEGELPQAMVERGRRWAVGW